MKSKIICPVCGLVAEKENQHINRNKRLGKVTYCSRKCSTAKWRNSEANKILLKHYATNGHNVKDYPEFRRLFLSLKTRKSYVDLTIEDLAYVWEKQEGKCAYLKIPLCLPNVKGKHNTKNPIYIGSVDRIDSLQGYTKSNI